MDIKRSLPYNVLASQVKSDKSKMHIGGRDYRNEISRRGSIGMDLAGRQSHNRDSDVIVVPSAWEGLARKGRAASYLNIREVSLEAVRLELSLVAPYPYCLRSNFGSSTPSCRGCIGPVLRNIWGLPQHPINTSHASFCVLVLLVNMG
jgi:hypothetical protein